MGIDYSSDLVYSETVWGELKMHCSYSGKMNGVSTLKFKTETPDYINQVPFTFLSFVSPTKHLTDMSCSMLRS